MAQLVLGDFHTQVNRKHERIQRSCSLQAYRAVDLLVDLAVRHEAVDAGAVVAGQDDHLNPFRCWLRHQLFSKAILTSETRIFNVFCHASFSYESRCENESSKAARTPQLSVAF